ncbi:MAG: ABC transporter ATP-binding protein/permease [Clostridiales bacterium]|jgi:ATP-binding cassette subfamily B protein|nr:ABC transporter ATP-binding protein/permease [Clostridiales bacterium]
MLKIFGRFDGRQRIFITVSLVFIIVQVWLDLKTPEFLSEITRLVITPGSAVSDVVVQGAFMLLTTLGSIVASIVVGYFAAVVATGLSKTLRGDVYEKTLSFSFGEIGKFSTASLLNRTTNDITQIQMFVAVSLQIIVRAPILAVWAIFKISGIHSEWTIAASAAVIFMLVNLTLILVVAFPRFEKIQTLTDNLNRVMREEITGIRVVRAYNAEEYQQKKFAAANDDLTNTNLIVHRVMALMHPTMTLVMSGLTLAIYWIGAYLIQAAVVAVRLDLFSDMVVFSNYAMQIIMAFLQMTLIFIFLPRAQVSARRINEVMAVEPSIKDGNSVLTEQGTLRQARNDDLERGTIEFENCSFKYPDAGDYVLKDISFKAKKGETVAFIGAIGSGKSTLLNLITRFYDATDGAVKINGTDVRDYKLKELYKILGYVPQKSIIFSGTVESNVAFGDNSDEFLQQAVKIAQAKDFIEQVAEIAQNGTNLSGGQKQRLSIARAIARKPEILIFDDSFSALDYRTDRALRKDLESNEATKLIVAQRIGTIKNADQIIVLEHGKIVGKGKHDELMKNCETYREIALSQLSKEELGGDTL